ncbi:hypothetical protein BDV12DRAFT_179492 [Aspergillus spectabilis]
MLLLRLPFRRNRGFSSISAGWRFKGDWSWFVRFKVEGRPGLPGQLYPGLLSPSPRAGVAPCILFSFAERTLRGGFRVGLFRHAFLGVVHACTVSALLFGVALKSDVAVFVAPTLQQHPPTEHKFARNKRQGPKARFRRLGSSILS